MSPYLKRLFEMTETYNLSWILFNKDERITYASSAACSLLNADFGQIEQQSIRAFFCLPAAINDTVASTPIKDLLGKNLETNYLLHHIHLDGEANYVIIFGDDESLSQDVTPNLDSYIAKLQTSAVNTSKNLSSSSQLDILLLDDSQAIESYFVNNNFKLFLQPIVNEFGQVIRFEVLTRLILADNIYGPGIFLPFIQRYGLSEKFDEYVLENTLKLLSSDFWRTETSLRKYCFAINISPTSNNFYMHIQNLVDLVNKSDIGTNVACLDFEITEGVLIQNAIHNDQTLMQVAQLLYDNNIMLSMDDFGVKNSSFERLIACDFDSIKVDMNVVSQLMNKDYSGKVAKVIMQLLVKLAADLELKLIVEGVENREIYLILQELGCKIFQGYYFFKPLPVHGVENLILQGKLDQFDKVIA